MKKIILIVAVTGLAVLLVVANLFFKQKSGMEEEREWFVKGLRYEFSARVDSVMMFNEHTGRVWGRVTLGNPKTHREDSLKQKFKEHDMLYLIFKHSGDSIIFIVPNGNHILNGDSVRISSAENSIQFFRNKQVVATDQLSHTLTGFGRPFFMKKK